MKGFRRSIGSKHDKPVHSGYPMIASSSTGSSGSAPAGATTTAAIPPKKVIKALHSYDATRPNELSFVKGDFFHVIGNEDDPSWYEASNPVTNARGLVPVDFFQVLEKTSKVSSAKTINAGPLNVGLSPGGSPSLGGGGANLRQLGGVSPNALGLPPGRQPLYGIVQFDFVAERSDELDVHAGEPIIIIAQSNHEWFVAKPIGRLGGPGLIPVSFIEIRDASTGRVMSQDEVHDGLISGRLGVPKVEEWKKMTAEYKKSSIPLGRFDFPEQAGSPRQPQQQQQMRSDGQYTQEPSPRPQIGQDSPTSSMTPRMIPVQATVESFHYEDNRYWFLLRATLKSPKGLGPTIKSDRVLYRLYDDFYTFQISLLDTFPHEAGRTGSQRILPLMPGPLSYVNDVITAQRRSDLDVYVKELCKLPDHIVTGDLVYEFFELKQGDVEVPAQASSHSSPLSGPRSTLQSRPTRTPSSDAASSPNGQPSQDVEGRMRRLKVDSNDGKSPRTPLQTTRSSDGSKYDDSDRLDDYYTQSHSSDPSEHYGLGIGRGPLSPRSEAAESFKGSDRVPSQASQSSTQVRSNGESYDRSHLPPNPHVAAGFIKIKIFYDADLIAIRVPPDVNYRQLVSKVEDKVGRRLSKLTWKGVPHHSSTGNRVDVDISSDREWDEIVRRNLKVVLYAD